MDRFVTELMGKMTLHEKLGQLNLPSGGDMVTGTVMNGELSDMIRKQENQRSATSCSGGKSVENTFACGCGRHSRL